MNKQLIKLAETTLLILEKKSWHSIDIDEVYNKTKINIQKYNNQVINNHSSKGGYSDHLTGTKG